MDLLKLSKRHLDRSVLVILPLQPTFNRKVYFITFAFALYVYLNGFVSGFHAAVVGNSVFADEYCLMLCNDVFCFTKLRIYVAMVTM